MRIKFRFQLSEPLIFPDKWPIKSGGIYYDFVGEGEENNAIEATLLNQPVNLAPTLVVNGGQTTIKVRHEILLDEIREKIDHLQCVLGMMLPIEIDVEAYHAEFLADNADEQKKIEISSWGEDRKKYKSRISFDLAAKGLLCDPWPESDRRASQFYRRARRAFADRLFVDAFVNFYFFLERLYAGGKFTKAQVARQFALHPEIQNAFQSLKVDACTEVENRGARIRDSLDNFCKWVVDKRGFFQHQSETDPNRWLHSTQEEYAPEAHLMALFAMSIYDSRYAARIFSREMDERWMAAAEEVRAVVEVVVDVLGHDPSGKPIRKRFNVNGPGTRVTPFMATEILGKTLEFADQHLISIRQLTATVRSTGEVVFLYNGPTNSAPIV